MYVKKAKIRLRKKSYNFGTNERMSMKIWYDNFKTSIYVMWKFQVRIFKHIWEISGQRASWPGRAGSLRISVLHRKRITFCSMYHIAKIDISRAMMLFCFPIWLWQEALCVDRRDPSRRVSLLRSLMTLVKGRFFIRLMSLSRAKGSDFENVQWILSYTEKYMNI